MAIVEKRRFHLVVTPLPNGPRAGAVVMPVNITARESAELRLERSIPDPQSAKDSITLPPTNPFD